MFKLRPLPATLNGHEFFYLVVTWFQSGRIRPASGSWGSLAAWPVCWALKTMGGNSALLLFGFLAFAAGIHSIKKYYQHSIHPDPSEVVIDEVVGMALTWLFIPLHNFPLALTGFILFRLFDAFKRGPVGWCDKNIKGAYGVIIDDVAAGILAGLSVFLIQFLLR